MDENSGGQSNGNDTVKWNILIKQNETKEKEVEVERQDDNTTIVT